jgi:hypothetical protein
MQVAINGGCWIKTAMSAKDCDEKSYGYVYKNVCYVPVIPPARPATSNPTEPNEAR